MKRIFSVVLVTAFLWACNSPGKKAPATALDAGREFIRASLDGDFETAETLLLKDTQNLQLFDAYKQLYGKLPADKKRNFKEASYTINKFVEENDSTTLINYSNSYMNKPMEIKLVRMQKNWNVDFKYTYSGNLPIE
jgi:hypothetical protein